MEILLALADVVNIVCWSIIVVVALIFIGS